MLSAETQKLPLDSISRRRFSRHDEGMDRFPKNVVGGADDGGLPNAIEGQQGLLDLVATDPLPPALDHVFGAVDYEDEAVFVDGSEVPGVQFAVSERDRRFFRRAPIPTCDIWAFGYDFTRFAGA